MGVVRRFSRFAGFALVAIGVAGALLTWNLSDGLAGGLTTPWVLILGGKVVIVGTAAALGAWGRRHLGRTPSRSHLRRLFLTDAALLLAIATLSAGLTLTSPHVGHAGHAGHGTPGTARCAAEVGDSSVSVIIKPARIGTNDVALAGIPDGVLSVTLRWVHDLTDGGALTMQAVKSDSGAWTATGALPLAGSWQVTVAIRVDTFTERTGACSLTVGS